MPNPHLTFFCELEAPALAALFQDPGVQGDLLALGASLSLALLDLSPERAAVVQRLSRTGIPVTAWLLLPREQGYFFNLDNAPQATAQYARFQGWTAEHGLRWAGVGLDFEPDIHELEGLQHDGGPFLRAALRRAFQGRRLRRGLAAYRDLIARIKADGYRVESYQFPMIADDRRAGSTLLQRTIGVLDVPVDREVLMLYSSLTGRHGPAMLWSYAQRAQAVAVGSTGGGVDMLPKLGWEELARDLRLASRWTDEVYVFSLEGCVQRGFLSRLRDFDWSEPATVPAESVRQVARFRAGLHALLWLSARPALLLALPGLVALWRVLGRRTRARG